MSATFGAAGRLNSKMLSRIPTRLDEGDMLRRQHEKIIAAVRIEPARRRPVGRQGNPCVAPARVLRSQATQGGTLLIRSFGMFWDRDEVEWAPGTGTKGGFVLLGRTGKSKATLRVADFRRQTGIYVLYNDWGPYYVGLTRRRGLGDRLRDHVKDAHAAQWTRFSWFGFQSVVQRTDFRGVSALGRSPKHLLSDSHTSIGDLEALLIKVLNASGNSQQMKFAGGSEWKQVERLDREIVLAQIRPR